jgi:hypothetical protein
MATIGYKGQGQTYRISLFPSYNRTGQITRPFSSIVHLQQPPIAPGQAGPAAAAVRSD